VCVSFVESVERAWPWYIWHVYESVLKMKECRLVFSRILMPTTTTTTTTVRVVNKPFKIQKNLWIVDMINMMK
jgi:hypothetical protein